SRASGSPRAASRGDSRGDTSSGTGSEPRAREFEPAVIDTPAIAVRVEKWAADGRLFYRVIGIAWGGAQRSAPWTDPLLIRFKSGEPWVRVERPPVRASAFPWEVWSHTWRPAAPGRYQIVLKVDDPAVRTRRLDALFPQ